MGNYDERKVDPVKEIIRLSQNFLDLDTWDFKESFRSDKSGTLIYDSTLCRMSITWGGWDYIGGNSISIYYGRFHAPNEDAKMYWNGEECYAWHEFEYPLHFLDGHSPAEVSKTENSHPLIDKYYEEEYRQKFSRRQPEWLMKMHAEVWDNYGERFFGLFDLQRSDMWEKYRGFLKEIYDIKGRPSFIKPPLDKVC